MRDSVGVSGNHAIQLVLYQLGGNILYLGGSRSGRDLHRNRHVFAIFVCQQRLLGFQLRQPLIEFVALLQLAHGFLGVGAGDVDGDIGRAGVYLAQTDQVIVSRVLDQRIGILPILMPSTPFVVGAIDIFDQLVDAIII